MSVYKKLQEARILLQNTKLNKSGKNKFAGFSYFELSDFIPQVTEIFNKIGLCGVVSFTSDTAYLTVHDTDGEGFITFTSPLVMAENAKGQAIQSLGSTHTYFRRYLWLMCMEITENDAIDAADGGSAPAKKSEDVSVTSVTTLARLAPKEATINVPKGSTATVTVKPIVGEAGEWQLTAPGVPVDGDSKAWLDLIATSTNMLLELTANDDDVMKIFKKNKVLFDVVKATDPEFFKDLMSKFTERKNMFIKEKA
jgi:hypothetical protein